MPRITLPGFSRGLYAVGPLIFEDGVCEYDGDLPPVVGRLAFALGASIDGADAPAEDPGLPEQDGTSDGPTPAEVWDVQDRIDAPPEVDEAEQPVIDYSAPTGGQLNEDPNASIDYSAPTATTPAGDAAATVDFQAPTGGQTADDGTMEPDQAPAEPDQGTTEPEQPAPDAAPAEDATPAEETPAPVDESTGGKHAADEPVDAEPATTTDPAPAESEPATAPGTSQEDLDAAQATESTVVASSTDGSTTVDAPAQGA